MADSLINNDGDQNRAHSPQLKTSEANEETGEVGDPLSGGRRAVTQWQKTKIPVRRDRHCLTDQEKLKLFSQMYGRGTTFNSEVPLVDGFSMIPTPQS